MKLACNSCFYKLYSSRLGHEVQRSVINQLSINHLTVRATVSITISFSTLLSDQGQRQKGNGRGRRKEGEKVLDPSLTIATLYTVNQKDLFQP